MQGKSTHFGKPVEKVGKKDRIIERMNETYKQTDKTHTVIRINEKTRPDTRPPVADGWAGAEMRVFTLFYSSVTTQA